MSWVEKIVVEKFMVEKFLFTSGMKSMGLKLGIKMSRNRLVAMEGQQNSAQFSKLMTKVVF